MRSPIVACGLLATAASVSLLWANSQDREEPRPVPKPRAVEVTTEVPAEVPTEVKPPAAAKPVRPATPAKVAPAAPKTVAPRVVRPALPGISDIDEEATHYQSGVIDVAQSSEDPHKVNAFCLDATGNILVACGAGPGEIRMLDGDGKPLAAWKTDVKPEAINVAPDGTILVGGDGQLFRYSAAGKLLTTAESPHTAAVRDSKAKLREQVIAQMKSRSNSLASTVEVYESIIAQLEERKKAGELGEQEEQILASLPKTLEAMKKQLADQPKEEEEPKIDEAQVEEQLKNMMRNKLRVASVSSDGKHVYVATYALEGYGFCVWRLDSEFTNGEVVVKDLRGCCGQMDVQVSESGIYVAENARHRVACFEPNGDLKVAWGKADRTGADGFTSCCNPMNVCFSKTGDVFTAESNTGRIKRFGADGTFKDFIGDVKLVPGCKNVSIAVAPDLDRVYMLDITRNHIVVMKKKTADPDAPAKPAKVSLR